MEEDSSLKSKYKCKINILDDFPVTSDEFDSHERIADAIKNLIDNEKGNKAIALTGGWGSGKSTVVEILKLKFNEIKKTDIFIFDAWAYKDNLLRRAFLERLINHFNEIEWIKDKKKWKDTKDELANRKEVRKQKSYTELTTWGKWALFSMLLYSIGLALISSSSNLSISWTGILEWNFIIGFLLSFSPLIIFSFVCIKFFFSKERKNEENNDKNNILSVFIKNSDTTIISETIKTQEPTSLEFDNFFTDLMEEVLLDGENTFVLVIDNLDRIDTHEALKIWATMRTFIETNTNKSQSLWPAKFWLLVPFDHNALDKLWPGNHNNNEEKIGEAFKDKTFQIVFLVFLLFEKVCKLYKFRFHLLTREKLYEID